MRPEKDLLLIGRYRFLERIAIGGMGEVWLARDQERERDVAIKVLREEHTGEPGFVNRFRAEARATSGLSHPGIAQTYAYGEQSGAAYIVMELVVAEPLSETLEREKTIAPQFTINILSQAARALHAAHEGGVVHRDVKPGNILVDENGRVKLTDFGIARAVGQPAMTEVGMVMGTAQYLSPEQVNGQPASPASDIYALGIVAYEMLVGNRPFTGTTPLEIAISHVEKQVPPLGAEIPRPLADLVMQTLEKDAAKRPASAQILADKFDECAHLLPDLQMTGSPGSQLAGPPSAGPQTAGSQLPNARLPNTASVHRPKPARPSKLAGPSNSPVQPERAGPKRRSRGARRTKSVATWTGQRLSWLTTPLAALVLLIVFATIGALIAGRIFAAAPVIDQHNGIMANDSIDKLPSYSFVDTSTIKDV